MTNSLWRLRQQLSGPLARIDHAAAEARNRATAATLAEQFPEYTMLRLLESAVSVEAATGKPWPLALHELLDTRAAAAAARRKLVQPRRQEEGTA